MMGPHGKPGQAPGEEEMEVLLEIHAPGLDLEHARWTYHLIFMKEVHERIASVAACARDSYRGYGRGTIFISRRQWISVVRDAVLEESVPFPCTYVSAEDAAAQFDFGRGTAGFQEVLYGYDPQRQFVLTVRHPPGEQLSCYLVDVGP